MLQAVKIIYKGGVRDRQLIIEYEEDDDQSTENKNLLQELTATLYKDKYFELKCLNSVPILEYEDPRFKCFVEFNENSQISLLGKEVFLRFQPLATPPKVRRRCNIILIQMEIHYFFSFCVSIIIFETNFF